MYNQKCLQVQSSAHKDMNVKQPSSVFSEESPLIFSSRISTSHSNLSPGATFKLTYRHSSFVNYMNRYSTTFVRTNNSIKVIVYRH